MTAEPSPAEPSPAELAEHSSSDIALRYRAPSCVAHRWRVAAAWVDEPGDQLKRRFAFVETALRYLVAVLASEHAARGLPEVERWSALVASLGGRPVTLGLWRDAAVELSRRVMEQPECITGPIARVLAERAPGGQVRRAEVCDALDRLVEIRNEAAHPECIATSNAAATLQESGTPFRRFLGALRGIGDLPPWVVVSHRHRDGVAEASVLCLRGTDQLPPRLVPVAIPLDDGRPFVVGAAGTVLYLSPMLAWGTFPAPAGGVGAAELRLLAGWKSGPLYADPLGIGGPVSPGVRAAGSFAEWVRTGVRVEPGVFDERPRSLDALRSPDRSEALPTVPGYTVDLHLGYGGNGRVYLAHHAERGDRVALKVLPSSLTADDTGRLRLAREYEFMCRVQHPNVARVYEWLPNTPSGPVLVMEHIAGENLRVRVERERFTPIGAVRVLRGVLSGLAAAHDRGIVHRDVTPDNVLVDRFGDVKLIDFGIAFAEGSERLTRTHDGLGKLSFAAPEQMNRPLEAGKPADVYACGRLLGYLVSGETDRDRQREALPGGLQALVRRATSEEPGVRHADARALLDDLERVVASGWDGPPVRLGERLSLQYEVGEIGRSLGGGLWLVSLREDGGERCLGIVAEHRPDAEKGLQAALAGLRPADRERFGRPDVRLTRDGLSWCRLVAENEQALGGVFGGTNPGPAGSAPDVGTPQRDVGTPQREADAPEEPSSGPASEGAGDRRPRPAWAAAACWDRGAPRWMPPPPSETGEMSPAPSVFAPAGALSLVAWLFVPLWPILVVWALVIAAKWRIPPRSARPLPPYLGREERFGATADPTEVARAFDELALIVAVQRLLRGAETGEEAKWRGIVMDPLHLAFGLFRLPPGSHVEQHRRALAGDRARLAGLGAIRLVHHALREQRPAIPPRSNRRINQALTALHRLAHAGAEGLRDDEVERWLLRLAPRAGTETARI